MCVHIYILVSFVCIVLVFFGLSPHDDVDDGDDYLYIRSERRSFPSDRSSRSRRSPPASCKCSLKFLPGDRHVNDHGRRLSAHVNLETGHTDHKKKSK